MIALSVWLIDLLRKHGERKAAARVLAQLMLIELGNLRAYCIEHGNPPFAHGRRKPAQRYARRFHARFARDDQRCPRRDQGCGEDAAALARVPRLDAWRWRLMRAS
ncbi:hypothetical protein V1318_01625 [Lysobacter sp. CCNWLW3]|uniref:hypothetical protein n=1 Tax=unclassified Lysobacter TaxID=2635362 RepID=UPI002FD23592